MRSTIAAQGHICMWVTMPALLEVVIEQCLARHAPPRVVFSFVWHTVPQLPEPRVGNDGLHRLAFTSGRLGRTYRNVRPHLPFWRHAVAAADQSHARAQVSMFE